MLEQLKNLLAIVVGLTITSASGKEAFKSDAYTQTQVLNAIAKARGDR